MLGQMGKTRMARVVRTKGKTSRAKISRLVEMRGKFERDGLLISVLLLVLLAAGSK